MVVGFVFFSFLLLFSLAGRLKSRCSSLGLWRVSCYFRRFWPDLFKMGYSFLEPDLHPSGVKFRTRAPLRRPPSSSAPAAGSSGHGGSRFPARGRHATEGLSFFGARFWSRPVFSGRARRWLGSPVVVPLLGDTGDGACPPRAAVSGGFCQCLLPEAALGVSVFLCIFPCGYCISQFVYL